MRLAVVSAVGSLLAKQKTNDADRHQENGHLGTRLMIVAEVHESAVADTKKCTHASQARKGIPQRQKNWATLFEA